MIFPFQRRTKQKVVTDFATLNKGASVGTKPRAALRQALFSQGVPEKNPASEVPTSHYTLTRHAYCLWPVIQHHCSTANSSVLIVERVFFSPNFCLFIFFLTSCSGERSAGFAEAGAWDLRCANQSEVDVEGGKSGNNSGEELDRDSGLSFGMSLLKITGRIMYF